MANWKITSVFLIAFFLNLAWEHLHSVLYIHYKGGEITNYVLLKASIADALFILFIVLVAHHVSLRYRSVFIFCVGLVLGLIIEWWALGSGRWAYSLAMPIIPIVQTGLTPTIQLAILGTASFLVSKNVQH
ncbi:hypothetical protein ACFL3E_00935 [Patescibacteria group bacterium]